MGQLTYNVIMRISNSEGVIRTRELILTPSVYQKYQDRYNNGESYKGYKIEYMALR